MESIKYFKPKTERGLMTIHQDWIGTTYLICSCGYFQEFPFMYPLNALRAADRHSLNFHNNSSSIFIQHKETINYEALRS